MVTLPAGVKYSSVVDNLAVIFPERAKSLIFWQLFLANYTLSDVLEKQDEIQQMILKLVDIATDPWGIRVTRVEIKDLRLPFDIQRSMAAEAESSREATAKVTAHSNSN